MASNQYCIHFSSCQCTAVAGCVLSLYKNQYWESRLQAFSSPIRWEGERGRERYRVVVTWRAPGVGPWASTSPSPKPTSRHCSIQTTKYVIPRRTKETWAWESNYVPLLVVSCSNLQVQRSLSVTTLKQLCQLAVAANIKTCQQMSRARMRILKGQVAVQFLISKIFSTHFPLCRSVFTRNRVTRYLY